MCIQLAGTKTCEEILHRKLQVPPAQPQNQISAEAHCYRGVSIQNDELKSRNGDQKVGTVSFPLKWQTVLGSISDRAERHDQGCNEVPGITPGNHSNVTAFELALTMT